MTIAIYNKKTFQVNSKSIKTFTDFTLGTSLQVESQDVKGKKPSSYIKGADLDKISFSIPLKLSLGHKVMSEYEDWKDMMESEDAYPFILGKTPISNTKWIILSVNISDTDINGNGVIIEGTLQIELQEYIRAGSETASNKKKKTTKVATKTSVDKNLLGYGTKDKGSQKRTNPSVTTAVAKGTKKGG